jgi:hypothetical protein
MIVGHRKRASFADHGNKTKNENAGCTAYAVGKAATTWGEEEGRYKPSNKTRFFFFAPRKTPKSVYRRLAIKPCTLV